APALGIDCDMGGFSIDFFPLIKELLEFLTCRALDDRAVLVRLDSPPDFEKWGIQEKHKSSLPEELPIFRSHRCPAARRDDAPFITEVFQKVGFQLTEVLLAVLFKNLRNLHARLFLDLPVHVVVRETQRVAQPLPDRRLPRTHVADQVYLLHLPTCLKAVPLR